MKPESISAQDNEAELSNCFSIKPPMKIQTGMNNKIETIKNKSKTQKQREWIFFLAGNPEAFTKS